MKRHIGIYTIGSRWIVKGYEHLGYLKFKSIYYFKGEFKAELYPENDDNVSVIVTDDSHLIEQEDILKKSLQHAKDFMKDPENVKKSGRKV